MQTISIRRMSSPVTLLVVAYTVGILFAAGIGGLAGINLGHQAAPVTHSTVSLPCELTGPLGPSDPPLGS